MPGPDFLRVATERGDGSAIVTRTVETDQLDKKGKPKKRKEDVIQPGAILHQLYLDALRKPGFQLPVMTRPGQFQTMPMVPGHIWGQGIDRDRGITGAVDGPHPAKVMVIGKWPRPEDLSELRQFMSPAGQIFQDMLRQLKIRGTPDWYVTTLCKFVPPEGESRIRASWLSNCKPLLQQELKIVRPDYILCLGSDAAKAILGKQCSLTGMEGRTAKITYDISLSEKYRQTKEATVMAVTAPENVIRDESNIRAFEQGLGRFSLVLQGIDIDEAERGTDYRYVHDLTSLVEQLWEIENDPRKHDDVISVDAEWHGEHPVNGGAYIRTIQLAWLEKHALCVRLWGPGQTTPFYDDEGNDAREQSLALLKAFFLGGEWEHYGAVYTFRRKRVVGHFFNADLEWLVHIGLDIEPAFMAPLQDLDWAKMSKRQRKSYRELGFTKGSTVPAWVRTKVEGGADTGLMAHAIEETASYKLETLGMRYTTIHRYDTALQQWIVSYCLQTGISRKDMAGYGDCPTEILEPYGCADADLTLRLFYKFDELLDHDYEGNCCREAFWESMIAAPAVLDIHQNGICVSRERIDYLSTEFLYARDAVEKTLKEWAKWPEFNIRSVQQVKEFLFGEKLNGTMDAEGKQKRLRPPEAETLRLQPIITTSKPPKKWADVVAEGKQQDYSPSTNKSVLALLAQEYPDQFQQVNWLRDYRFLDQVLKSALRAPQMDDDGGWLHEPDDPESLVYDAGLATQICSDNRIRTHIYQTKETGRWSSARPPLQNLSKLRDDDYKRMLGAVKNERGKWVGGRYKFPIRGIFEASPGHLIVEADFTGAELFGMAIMADDPVMIDHATRNQLPESDPNFYDIHSNVAKLAFSLPCEPTKTGLDSIGRSKLRIVAKSVIFGIAYGRGAKAIAMAAKEQGIQITVDEAQQVIDTIFRMYPKLEPFFDQCKSRAINERWLCNCFGRFRRFSRASQWDGGIAGEFERQAMNFPIQSMIASAMSRAMAWLHAELLRKPGLFRILLQIHDAVVLEVPYKYVEYVTQKVLLRAMRHKVPIYPAKLDGTPLAAGPYYLGMEAEVMQQWGVPLTAEQGKAFGLPGPTWAKDGIVVKYYSK